MSAREAELAEIQAAERQSGLAYEGSRARKNHVGSAVGLEWASEVEDAIKGIVGDAADNLVILVSVISRTQTGLNLTKLSYRVWTGHRRLS